MSLPEKYDHPLYKHVKDEKESDAVAWAFVNKEKVVKFPFKFPPLGPKELRANILDIWIKSWLKRDLALIRSATGRGIWQHAGTSRFRMETER